MTLHLAPRPPLPLVALHRAVLLSLVVSLLLTSFTGHAGMQVIDGAFAQTLLRTHRHGVPGEADYIHTHGTWHGFVAEHCHRSTPTESQPGPDHVQSAITLAGAVDCATTTPLPAVSGEFFPIDPFALTFGEGVSTRPLAPPPQR